MFSIHIDQSLEVPVSGVSICLRLFVLLSLFVVCLPAVAQSSQTNVSPITVSGQVVNSVSGQPVSRALVRLGERAILTNYEGRFRFDQVTENGALMIAKPGYWMSPDSSSFNPVYIRLDQPPTPLTVRIYPEALITVKITDPDGDPLQGISLSAQLRRFDGVANRWIPASDVTTDSHGKARIPLPAGDYKLTTRYIPPSINNTEALLPLTVPVQTSTDSSPTIHLHYGEEIHLDLHPPLRHAYPVNLRFEGLPAQSNPSIIAICEDGSPITLSPERGAASGMQRITLPSGTYTLRAQAGQQATIPRQMAETKVTVSNAELSGVVLNFMPVPSIPVTLSVDPAANYDSSTTSAPNLNQLGLVLQILQSSFDNGNGQDWLQSSNGGSFFAVPFGTYRLRARSEGQWHIVSATYGNSDLLQGYLVSAPGAGGDSIHLVVSNQAGSVQGTTSLGGSAAPSWIYLVSTAPSPAPIISLRSKADGSFSVTGVPAGSYQMLALEQLSQIDFSNPAVTAPFTSYIHTVIVETGMASNLNLEVVPFAKIFH